MIQIDEKSKILVGVGEEFSLADTCDDSKKMLVNKAYEKLCEFLKDKNYYIVSMCTDDVLKQFELKQDRMVFPCGTQSKLQCSENCQDALFDLNSDLRKCPNCGAPMSFNTIMHSHKYCEKGYLENWANYLKWLQGTINRELFVLELGVGLKYPSVFRWPAEKVVMYNQKSKMYRVNHSLYQVAEEIHDRCIGIEMNAPEWVVENL